MPAASCCPARQTVELTALNFAAVGVTDEWLKLADEVGAGFVIDARDEELAAVVQASPRRQLRDRAWPWTARSAS